MRAAEKEWTPERAAQALSRVPHRISHIIRPWAETAPDHPALVEGGTIWTYGQLAAHIASTRATLAGLGVQPGDRVMIVSENSLAQAVLLLAAAEMDAWGVIVNSRLSAREIDQIRDHSGARRVFYTVGVSGPAAAHAERHGAKPVEIAGLAGAVAVGPLIAEPLPEPVHADGADQVAVLIYTSGTTGHPKGVMLTHRNVLYIAAISGGMRRLDWDDRVYGVLPITHVFGFASVFLGTLFHGATLFLTPRFDPAAVVESLEKDRLTVLQGVPAMFARLIEHLRITGQETVPHPALRFLSAGGSPLDPAIKADVEAVFGLPLNNGYGLTECAPTIAQTLVEKPCADCSVGPILTGIEAKLVGTDGSPVQPGGIGELWVRGPTVMKGYYQAPAETAEVLTPDRWFNTRDLARFEDGNLHMVGRSKELIIRSGFNVYPPEVEAVLNAHPLVTQSAVVGRSVAGNEEVVAFVQLQPGAKVTPEAISAFAAERLAPYKRPSEVVLLETLPASSTGKVMKSRLAELAQAGSR
ncbi:acyl--CoA ligase [Skermanella rosea]|uniref:class I adenylate-forming enzyme family protein n=1 Tax=Skermanella rosea TaxID=1817965 RepID=UPI0019339F2E|nr:class I adenylate-forming enzyme family protein [Skermanella rosea]UEM01330.1 acyl--CoA ligase [Skermanella rosea]